MQTMFKKRRKYDKRVLPRLLTRKEFIIQHLRKEWDVMEKATKKEDVVRAVKSGGAALGRGLLILLAIAGTLTVTVVAPNIFSAFGIIKGRRSPRTYFHKKWFQNEIANLKRRKYLEIQKNREGEFEINLTQLGEKRIIQKSLSEFQILKSDRWDGTWRVVIFDIPNRHKVAREGFRERLKIMGFYPVQESVFVFPYPCYEEFKFLTYIYSVGDYVRFIETDKIIYDDDLRKHFLFS